MVVITINLPAITEATTVAAAEVVAVAVDEENGEVATTMTTKETSNPNGKDMVDAAAVAAGEVATNGKLVTGRATLGPTRMITMKKTKVSLRLRQSVFNIAAVEPAEEEALAHPRVSAEVIQVDTRK